MDNPPRPRQDGKTDKGSPATARSDVIDGFHDVMGKGSRVQSTTTQRDRTGPSASSHPLTLTPGHGKTTSPNTGSAENKSSADSSNEYQIAA